jgi:uncharacterized protein (DUF4415 family)
VQNVKLKNIDVAAVARAIEADAGKKLPGLRKSLEQAKRGDFGAVHTPQMIAERRRGRPVGSRKATSKVAVKLRLDPDVVEALRATGDGWQTRVNDTLRATLKLAGQL